jgi:hypothetical protein
MEAAGVIFFMTIKIRMGSGLVKRWFICHCVALPQHQTIATLKTLVMVAQGASPFVRLSFQP